MIAVLLAILLLLLIVALPTWPYSRTWGWGYYPSSGFGILLLIVIIWAPFIYW